MTDFVGRPFDKRLAQRSRHRGAIVNGLIVKKAARLKRVEHGFIDLGVIDREAGALSFPTPPLPQCCRAIFHPLPVLS